MDQGSVRSNTHRRRGMAWPAVTAIALAVLPGIGDAQVLYTNTSTVSSGAPPIEQTLNTNLPEPVTITLTDLGVTAQKAGVPFPTPLASLNLAVTDGATIETTLSAPGTAQFAPIANGVYVIRIVGEPAAGAVGNSGAISVLVQQGGNTLKQFSGTFQTPAAVAASPYGLGTQSFTVQALDNYTLTLRDLNFPASLSALQALVLNGTATVGNPISVPPGGELATALNQLAPGTYQVFLLATAAGSPPAGLYGVQVTSSGGAALLDTAVPVATTAPPAGLVASAGASLTLTADDLAEPMALAQLIAKVTNGSTAVAAAAGGAGPAPFTAPAPTEEGLRVWTAAQAAAGNAGGYSVVVAPAGGGAALYSGQGAISSSQTLFPYLVNVKSGGSYAVNLSDLEFPVAFTALTYTLYQGAAQVGQGAAGANPSSFRLQPGPAILAVNAVAQAGGSGLFGTAVTPTAGGAALFDATQAVSESFLTQEIVVINAVSYDFTLKDLGWPAAFSTLDVVLTQNGRNLDAAGKIYGGGTFSLANVQPGRYVATILAVPAVGQSAGLYNLSVKASLPTVTLSASPMTIPSGQGVTLTWSSTNATACNATGGWMGQLGPSGSKQEGPLMADTTYMLACTATSGSSSIASVKISIESSGGGGGGGGGGGTLGLDELVGFALLAALRVRRSRSRHAIDPLLPLVNSFLAKK